MDRHELRGLTPEQVAGAHIRDLEVQAEFGVQFLYYWFDYERQTAFCLAQAPSREALEDAHRAAHGLIPIDVIEVDQESVDRFLGLVSRRPGEPYVDTAFRTILFTDIEGSTAMTQQLGDARAMALLRTHDRIVDESVRRHGGSVVKHTGDGLMASFRSVSGAIQSAIQMQRELAESDAALMHVRVGIAAGEPVAERDDLFGAAVQLAARLCQRAKPGTILVSGGVRELTLGKGFDFRAAGRMRLKGFAESQLAYEVAW
jgi:class 3 adenylate cyclase